MARAASEFYETVRNQIDYIWIEKRERLVSRDIDNNDSISLSLSLIGFFYIILQML